MNNGGNKKPKPLNDEQLRELTAKMTADEAIERFHYLDHNSSNLTLPRKYSLLLSVFEVVDEMVNTMLVEGRLTMFSRLRREVSESIRKSNYFTIEMLGQIKAVYPEAYDVDLVSYKLPSTDGMFGLWVKPGGGRIWMSNELLIERRNTFHDNLLCRTMFLHEAFLNTTKFGIPEFHRVRRWHPQFFRSSFVTDIKPVVMPLPAPNERQPVGSFISEYKELVARSAGKLNKETAVARVPEIVRLTKQLFTEQNQVVMIQDYVLSEIGRRYVKERLSTDELLYHYYLLADYVPGWLAIFYINEDAFMELSEVVNVNDVISKFEIKVLAQKLKSK